MTSRRLSPDGRRQLVDMVVARAASGAKLDPSCAHDRIRPPLRHLQARQPLLLIELDRVIKLLSDDDGRSSSCFAGKAHPADEPGKALLTQVNEFGRPRPRTRSVRVRPDYDIRGRPHAVSRLRRVAQQSRAAARSVWHERHESRAQRQPQLLDP
jgi:hypothetical protein